MKISKKVSLNDFFVAIPDDEEVISAILENGLNSAYERADYDLFIAWLFLLKADLDNDRDSRIIYHQYKSWSGCTDRSISAYDQNVFVRYDSKDNVEHFSFQHIEYNEDDENSDITIIMKPLVEDLIKKIKDKKENGSV